MGRGEPTARWLQESHLSVVTPRMACLPGVEVIVARQGSSGYPLNTSLSPGEAMSPTSCPDAVQIKSCLHYLKNHPRTTLSRKIVQT